MPTRSADHWIKALEGDAVACAPACWSCIDRHDRRRSNQFSTRFSAHGVLGYSNLGQDGMRHSWTAAWNWGLRSGWGQTMAGAVVSEALRKVVFRLDGRRIPGVRSVVLTGTFNQWDGSTHRLVLDDNGWWTATLFLPPGAYSYLFLVDGFPWNDPKDDLRVQSEWGGQYSVRIVQ